MSSINQMVHRDLMAMFGRKTIVERQERVMLFGEDSLPPALAERLSYAWGRHNMTAMLLMLAPPSVERCEPIFLREAA